LNDIEEGSRMKIIIHDYAGYAFPAQLSRQLVQRGYTVKFLYAGYNNAPKGDLTLKRTDLKTLSFEPIYTRKILEKYKFSKRWFQEREYGQLLAQRIIEFHPDIIISSDTPLDAQRAAWQASQKCGASFIFWLQDVIGIATWLLLRKRLSIVGEMIGKYYIAMEKNLLRKSDHVVAISKDFLPLLQEWSVPGSKITVLPNWAPLDNLPVCPKNNPWSIHQGLDKKICFMYTGTLGMKHDPNALLQLALYFHENDAVRVVVISEGPGAEWLKIQKSGHDLENLLILAYQPFDQLPNIMGAADVLIALLEPDAGVFSVPSKVLTYLCAQRPILAAIPEENLAAKIITHNHAGIIVSPGKMVDFLKKAEEMLEDTDARKKMGTCARAYAETHFNIKEITMKYEEVIRKSLS